MKNLLILLGVLMSAFDSYMSYNLGLILFGSLIFCVSMFTKNKIFLRLLVVDIYIILQCYYLNIFLEHFLLVIGITMLSNYSIWYYSNSLPIKYIQVKKQKINFDPMYPFTKSCW